MDYNKLKNKIISSYKEVKIFFEKEGEIIDFTEGGFYQAARNESLKISMLEKISEKLQVPMSYWWDEKESVTDDIYEDNRRMKNQIDDLIDDKYRMKQEIDDLRQKLGETSVKRKATG